MELQRRRQTVAVGHSSHDLFPFPQHVFRVGGEGQGEGARSYPLAQIMLCTK